FFDVNAISYSDGTAAFLRSRRGGIDGSHENPGDEQRLAPGGGRFRDRRRGGPAVRARRKAARVALPLWPLRQQAVLRQHPQDDRVRLGARRIRPAGAGAQARRLVPRPRSLAVAGFVIASAAVCVRLGFWQLSRLEHKRHLNAAMREALSLPPTTVTDLRLPPDS